MSRLLYIDYLRNFANITRCLIHAAVPYMITLSPMWPLKDNGSWFFDFAIFETHLYVMELFFMISGFLFAIQLNRNNVQVIIKNIFKRIIVPFLLGLIIIVPTVLTFFSLSNYSAYSFLEYESLKVSYINGWALGFENFFPTAHLWFLYYLILFYVITLLFRKQILRIKISSFLKLIIVSIVLSSICMFFMKRWIIDNPLTLIPELPSLIHYFMFFIIGVIGNNSRAFINQISSISNKLLFISLIFSFCAIIPQLWFENKDFHFFKVIEVVAILLSSSSSYLLVFAFWGFFKKRNFKNSKYLQYLTDSSYWVYLSNMPIVMFLQLILIPLNISIFIKFIMTFIGAFTLSLITYEYFVRYTFVGELLNKKRTRNYIFKS